MFRWRLLSTIATVALVTGVLGAEPAFGGSSFVFCGHDCQTARHGTSCTQGWLSMQAAAVPLPARRSTLCPRLGRMPAG
jgi:hypothetical protein